MKKIAANIDACKEDLAAQPLPDFDPSHISKYCADIDEAVDFIEHYWGDKAWETSVWLGSGQMKSQTYDFKTFPEAYKDFLKYYEDRHRKKYRAIETRICLKKITGNIGDWPHQAVLGWYTSQDDSADGVREDLDAEPLDTSMPDFDIAYINPYRNKDESLDHIKEDWMEKVWEVSFWDRGHMHGTTGSNSNRAVANDGVVRDDEYVFDTFPVAYKEFLDMVKYARDHSYQAVELRKKLAPLPTDEPDEQYLSFRTVLAWNQTHNLSEAEESPKGRPAACLTKQGLLDDLLKVFGTVKPSHLTDAVYILPSGKVMDTKGPYESSQHDNIPRYIEEVYRLKDTAPESGSLFMNSIGAIRVTPWIPGVVVPRITMTEAQENTLYKILKGLSLSVSDDKPLMVLSEDGRQYIEYKDIKNPEDVITNIMGYQALGLLREKMGPGCEMDMMGHLRD